MGGGVEHSNAADGLACDPMPPTPLSRRPYGAGKWLPELMLLAWAAADSYVTLAKWPAEHASARDVPSGSADPARRFTFPPLQSAVLSSGYALLGFLRETLPELLLFVGVQNVSNRVGWNDLGNTRVLEQPNRLPSLR